MKHVRRWADGSNSFTIDCGQYKNEYFSVKTDQGQEMTQLLNGYVDILLKRQREGRLMVEDDTGEIAKIEDLGDNVLKPSGFAEKVGSKNKGKEPQQKDADKPDKPDKPDNLEACKPVDFVEPAKDREPVVPKKSANDTMSNLIRLQTFIGSWKLNAEFASAIGVELSQLESWCGKLDADVLATSVAIAFLLLNFSQHEVIFKLLVQKAKDFISSKGENAEETVEAAKKLLQQK